MSINVLEHPVLPLNHTPTLIIFKFRGVVAIHGLYRLVEVQWQNRYDLEIYIFGHSCSQ